MNAACDRSLRHPGGAPRLILVMGVSGCGKTSVGSLLARRLGCHFVDADDHHPPANVDKMRAGIPLDDHDRGPWLAQLNALLRQAARRGESVVLACSALRERYRARLAQDLPGGLELVHLRGDFETIAARLAARSHRYMPAALLRSQFDALEAPVHAVIEIEVAQPLAAIVEALWAHFSLRPASQSNHQK